MIYGRKSGHGYHAGEIPRLVHERDAEDAIRVEGTSNPSFGRSLSFHGRYGHLFVDASSVWIENYGEVLEFLEIMVEPELQKVLELHHD